jgi:hypothetical protein
MKLCWLGAYVAVFLGLAGPAQAQSKKIKVENLDSATFLTDGKGHYIAFHYDKRELYYSRDGKRFHKQHIRGMSSSKNAKSTNFWAPNVAYISNSKTGLSHLGGKVVLRDGRWTVNCGGVTTSVFEVSGKRKQKLKRATFLSPKHRRALVFIGRDDEGVYYVVDKQLRGLGGGDQHLYRGVAGSMKKQTITELINDGVGLLIRTNSGTFSKNIVNNKVSWRVKGKPRSEVFEMSTISYEHLPYTTLGIYSDPLGTPCDDL